MVAEGYLHLFQWDMHVGFHGGKCHTTGHCVILRKALGLCFFSFLQESQHVLHDLTNLQSL